MSEPTITVRVDPSRRGPGLVVVRILVNGGNDTTGGLTIERLGSPSTVDNLISELKVLAGLRQWEFDVIDKRGAGGAWR